MPRDGSNVYTQPFPNVIDGTTIESAVYNGFTTDVTLDLNTPRPIVAGGTGASSADAALVNLGAEKSAQVVTNYDSHSFVNGSFISADGATGAPSANAAEGICYGNNAGFMTLEAREMNSGIKWVRQKIGGTWYAWEREAGTQAQADARYVNVTGDTMTGALTATGKVATSSASAPAMFTYNTTDANGFGFYAQSNLMTFAEFDSAGGSTGTLGFFNAAGAFTTAGPVSAPGFSVTGSSGFSISTDATSRSYTFIAGCNIRFVTTDSHMYFANGGGDGFRLQNDGNILMLNGKLPYRPGGGPWLDNSDERIKNVIGDYEHGLAEITALQPVRYTFKGNNTGPGETLKDGASVPYENSPHYTQARDSTEFIGLIAQAVETVMPEMVAQHAATIDDQPVTDLRTLDTGPLIFALINAIKTLTERIEALEAG